MANVLRSLEDISTRYCIFERDQVLTHTQLNELASYLDDQQRLTRISLFGIGVACGLRVTVQDGRPVLGRGFGVTSDGDLIRVPQGVSFTRFKAYDQTAPIYPPFYDGETMRPVFELVAEDAEDAAAAVLSDFEGQTGRKLADMVAVLYMESYVKDEDLCSGTDCDNKGQESLHTLKLLVIDASAVSALQQGLPTLDAAARSLPHVFADRPLLSAAINSAPSWFAPYRAACTSIRTRLTAALRQLFTAGSPFLADLFPSDPAPDWIARLEALDGSIGSAAGLQYYYGFLKDLVETYTAFREALFDDTTVCTPDVVAFPKHLLLGVVGAAAGASSSRTAFYPSPALTIGAGRREHARFLALKLHTLINTFRLPGGSGLPIRVTPSRFEDAPLEERAIPFYYEVNSTLPIHRAWNHTLQRRGMEQHNYSYNAPLYDAQGAAASPLAAQIGAYAFFRVEGHVGSTVSAASSTIEREIAASNLPFTVRSVMVGTDRTRVKKPPIRYTDLHRLHYLLRQDVSQQLDEVVQFSGAFSTQIEAAAKAGTIGGAPEETDGMDVTQVATQKHAAVTTNAGAARSKLSRQYAEYRADPVSWQSDIREAVTAGSELKVNLGKVSRTEVVTPVDSLIANNHMLWVNWLDEIIKDKEDKEDDRLLMPNFLRQHPGAEHFAGVVRGGTFVLVHDADGRVVGDLMLPYYWPEVVQDEPEERPLPRPPIKPDLILKNPVRVTPSIDRFVKDRLATFKRVELEPAWKNEIDLRSGNYVKALKESMDVLGKGPGGPITGQPGGPRVTDEFLDLRMRDTETKMQIVDRIRGKLLDPALDQPKRTLYELQLKDAEQDLARSITNTTNYVATANLDVTEGSEGFTAMTNVTAGLAKLADRGALTRVHRELTKVSAGAAAPVQSTIGNVIKTRFGNR